MRRIPRKALLRLMQRASSSSSVQPAVTGQAISARQQTFTPKRIDTVPAALHRHLFGTEPPAESATDERLEKLRLPKLRGANLQEHFHEIAAEQIAPFKQLLDTAAAWDLSKLPERPSSWAYTEGWTRYGFDGTAEEKVPYPYEPVFAFDVEVCVKDGHLPTLAVALTDKSWYSWCSGRLVNEDVLPPKVARQKHLIPLGGGYSTSYGEGYGSQSEGYGSHGYKEVRLAIGHYIGYDRVRSAEPYDLKGSSLRFWDTAAMSLPMFGMADHHDKVYNSNDLSEFAEKESWRDEWKSRVTPNSLAAVHRFLFNGRNYKDMDKTGQRVFVDEPIENIRAKFQDLMSYCANDVKCTLEIYQKLLKSYYEHFPHPATMAGMLEMSSAFLPVNKNWPLFYEKAQAAVKETNFKAVKGVMTAMKERFHEFQERQDINGAVRDPFLWAMDFSVPKGQKWPSWMLGVFSAKKAAEKYLNEEVEEGKEQELVDSFSLKSNVIPMVFGLCYLAYPLYHKHNEKWCFWCISRDAVKKDALPRIDELTLRDDRKVVFPAREIRDLVVKLEREHGAFLPEETKNPILKIVGLFSAYRMPHPDGVGKNVGFPLGKRTFSLVDDGVIRASRNTEEFKAYLAALESTSFWNSFRNRYESELAVWLDGDDNEKDPSCGVIAPSILSAGTVSRRSTHNLWVTTTNASGKDDERIGTAIKSMVQAHPGTCIVGADVDSQEQWLGALFGDASASASKPESERRQGCTPFSNMLLAGSKSDRSDLHSVIAADMSIDRDSAKVLNYARLYGAGERHACELLIKKGLNQEKAKAKASELFRLTKGVTARYRRLDLSAHELFERFLAEKSGEKELEGYLQMGGRYYLRAYEEDCKLTMAFEDWVMEGVRVENNDLRTTTVLPLLYGDKTMSTTVQLFSGGYESDTFNFLEVASHEEEQRTPVLGARLGSSFSPLPIGTKGREDFSRKYKRSVINWMVQSSAVDFLHLLLVCLRWLCHDCRIDARFCLSIHDEVRYVVASRDASRFALALHLANMYVRAAISERLGLRKLPASIAFFSSVDVDSVLRKEVNTVVHNPDGATVPHGQAMNIYDVIEKTGGSLEMKEEE